jgi:hypothetical protein
MAYMARVSPEKVAPVRKQESAEVAYFWPFLMS